MWIEFILISCLGMVQAGQEEIRDLIQALGADAPLVRDQATQRLVAIGEQALPLLRGALKSDDPEIRDRVARAIDGIQWIIAENRLDEYLQTVKIPRAKIERRHSRQIERRLPDVRLYRAKTEAGSILITLGKEGEVAASKTFAEGSQAFVVDLLKDIRAATDDARIEVAWLCLAVLDQFEFAERASPGGIALHWPMGVIDCDDGPKRVGFGGGWSKNPYFEVGFDATGRVRSVDFAYKSD
jgi:hypothetical protein